MKAGKHPFKCFDYRNAEGLMVELFGHGPTKTVSVLFFYRCKMLDWKDGKLVGIKKAWCISFCSDPI